MKTHKFLYLYLVLTTLIGACGRPSLAGEHSPQIPSPVITSSSAGAEPMESNLHPTPSPNTSGGIPVTGGHLMQPSGNVPVPSKMVDDVESSGTGPEGRAPYGDSYKLNRFERPFLKDMTYVPDMDIHKFGLSEDETWYYVSIHLIGNDPNNALGINYGAEIDLNADGFGDYLIWAHPPYAAQWDTTTVQVFQDTNGDSAGGSATQSDAIFDGNGHDTLLFDGSGSQNTDPDLAWVRLGTDPTATIQIAFKKSLTGPAFMLGVVADGGPKEVSKFDYADHFIEAEAGSPVRDSQYYPLGSLYAIDNTCWQAYGMQTTGYEPKLCPNLLPPPKPTPKHRESSGGSSDGSSGGSSCPEVLNCGEGGTFNPSTCQCE